MRALRIAACLLAVLAVAGCDERDRADAGTPAVTRPDPDRRSSSAAHPSLVDRVALRGGGDALFALALHRVVAGYEGPAIRVVRTAGSELRDVYFVGDELDIASLAELSAGSDLRVVTVYDQTGNGRHHTQSTPSYQPKIWDAVTGLVGYANGKPAIFFDALNAAIDASGQRRFLHAADHGASNTSALTLAVTWNDDRILPSTSQAIVGLSGSGGAATGVAFQFAGVFPRAWVTDAAFHEAYEPAPNIAQLAQGYVLQLGAGASVSTATIATNGEHDSREIVGGASTAALAGGGSTWGGTDGNGLPPPYGRSSSYIAWPSVLTGDALDELRAYHDEQIAGDLEPNTGGTIVVMGQSNAEFLIHAPVLEGWDWERSVRGGTEIASWMPDAAPLAGDHLNLFDRLVATIGQAHRDKPLVCWWRQGENNVNDPSYGSEMAAFYEALVNAIGRPIDLWIDTLIHEDVANAPGYGDPSAINAMKIAYATSLGEAGTYLDPTPYGGLAADHLHDLPSLRVAMADQVGAAVLARWPTPP